MTSAPLEPIRWSPRRWLCAIAIAFVAQIALLWFFGDRPRPRPARSSSRPIFQLAADPDFTRKLSEAPLLSDPTLLALPSVHGFSGAAWLNFLPVEHRLQDWSEPPRWMAMDTQHLGQTFAGYVATNTPRPLLIADKPMPRLTGYDLDVPNETVPGETSVVFEGALAQRSLSRPVLVRSWPHTDVLTNTVLEAIVDAAGQVFSVTMLGGCGKREADDFAYQAALAARFEPLPQSSTIEALEVGTLTWGKMVFRWHTIPRTETNVVERAR